MSRDSFTRTQPTSRGALISFLLPALLLLPFVGKAFHIDDPHFLRMAQHIVEHPFDYYGYEMTWSGHKALGFVTNFNPPGVGYLWALVASVAGWGEIPLHLASTLIACIVSLGIYALATKVSSRPLMAVCVAVLSPAYIVSASTLMSDIPMLGLYVWALYCWIDGIDRDKAWLLALAGILIGFAIITKYFGTTAIPLALAFGLARKKAPGRWMLYLLIPIAMLSVYMVHTHYVYGMNHYTYSMRFAGETRAALGGSMLAKLVTVIPYLGACMASALFYLIAIGGKRLRIAMLTGLGLASVAAMLVPNGGLLHEFYSFPQQVPRLYLLQVAVFAVSGIALFVVLLSDLVRHRDEYALLLFLWLAGTVVYGVAVAPVLGVRVLIPAIPPAALLVSRITAQSTDTPRARLPEAAALLLATGLAVWLLIADYQFANSGKAAAEHFTENKARYAATAYFSGNWGANYYMEDAGAVPLSVSDTDATGRKTFSLRPGDTLIVPQNYEPLNPGEGQALLLDTFIYPVNVGITTWSQPCRAGFFGEFMGRLPFVIATPPPEEYLFFELFPQLPPRD